MNRRDALGLVLRAGAGAAGLHALLLTGCSSAGSARNRRGSVGDPIPEDPPIARAPGAGSTRSPSAPVSTGSTSPSPGVISRAKWARGAPRPWLADQMGSIQRITVHHDGMSPFFDSSWGSAAQRIEAIRSVHIGHGWADIGYHYIVDPAGRVWEARPLALQGAHVKDLNPHNLGICVLGNFEQQSPTSAAVRALEDLISVERSRFGVALREVYTHQELAATACPGRSLQAEMSRTRAWGGRLRRS